MPFDQALQESLCAQNLCQCSSRSLLSRPPPQYPGRPMTKVRRKRVATPHRQPPPPRSRPRRPCRHPPSPSFGRRMHMARAAVIDFGGFLGVGSRKIVVDWNALHFGRIANKSDSITLELTKDQVTAAPEYKEDTPIVVLGASGSLQPLQFGP